MTKKRDVDEVAEKTTTKEVYPTRTLPCVAFLMSQAIDPLSVDSEMGVVTFHFPADTEKTKQLVDSFYSGTASVDPNTFFLKIKQARQLMESAKRVERENRLQEAKLNESPKN